MKKRITFILVLVLLYSFCVKNVLANELCSPVGYSIYTINGINTDEKGAQDNKKALGKNLPSTYNNQPLTVDYLYNPTHGMIVDLLDSANQKYFDQENFNIQDSDFASMLTDASQKVTTQKILLVGHSQGNFYANTFYDTVADEPGGVPSRSIGVYSVATPATHVAGNGLYLTSDTDKVIAGAVTDAPFTNILKPNAHINFQQSDDGGLGHDFSKIYLAYQGDKIVSDIKSSLNKLKENDEQDGADPCISPPKLTLTQKVQGAMFAVIDPVSIPVQNSAVAVVEGATNVGMAIVNGINNSVVAISNEIGSLLASPVVTLQKDAHGLAMVSPEAVDSMTSTTSIPTTANNSSENNSSIKNNSTTVAQISASQNVSIKNPIPSSPKATYVVSNFSGGGGGGGVTTPPLAPLLDQGGEEADTTPPVITILGNNPASVIVGAVYTDAGATAMDDVDGVRDVTTTGTVDTTTAGTYTIAYTATDLSGNVATATRTVNVIAPVPDTTPPVITILGDNPAVVLVGSNYTDAGAIALDNIDGAKDAVTNVSTVDTTRIGTYAVTYTATDAALNTGTATRTVRVATYKYIPKYSFGKNNGDGNNWQVWSFNGSNVYDWTDTYVNNYLHEQFKIQTYTGGFWCSECLQFGVFNHDPQEGFESSDVTISGPDRNPQNNMNGITYNIALQWDSGGYTYTIFHGSVVDFTGHTNVANMNNNSWIGWDGSFNYFKTFPSGNWQGITYDSPMNRTGGSDMILQPFPVYKIQPAPTVPALFLPNKDGYAGTGIDPTRGRTNLTPFNFEVIYTDENNNAPRNVKLHVTNATTGAALPDVDMQKISGGADALSDGNFSNGEAYVAGNILYDTGDYNYYFTAVDSAGNEVRIPENDSLDFGVIPSSYTYIPKDSFGTNNGDGNNWQAWSFNGSNIYGWTDTYVNNYLNEQFKIQTYTGGLWASEFPQRGIFNHDPQKGFESSDVVTSTLENDPQNNMNGVTYDVAIQWDSGGYTYTIFHGSVVDFTGHTNVANMNNNSWVGWDDSYNNFKTFPSGNWQGVTYHSPGDLTGGGEMMLQPYPIYLDTGNTESSTIPPTDTSSDTAPPIITALSFSPSSGDAKIGDTITLSISADQAGYMAKNISINNVPATNFTDNGNGTYSATYTVAQGDKDETSGNIPVSVVLADASGNSNVAYATVAQNTLAINADAQILPPILSSDDSLSNLLVDSGTLNPAFSATQISYSVILPVGTTAVPVVSAMTADSNATEIITQAASTMGSATVTVKAQDAVTIQTYTINFSVAVPDNTVTQLKIITPPQTIGVNTASGIITVESQNASGIKTNVSQTTDVNLSSSSATGTFTSASASSNSCGSDWLKKEITISKGNAHESFCYQDSALGTPTITISSGGLSPDSQIITVN